MCQLLTGWLVEEFSPPENVCPEAPYWSYFLKEPARTAGRSEIMASSDLMLPACS